MEKKKFEIVVGYNNKNFTFEPLSSNKKKQNHLLLVLILGAIIGFINGFFGGGGGMICVPVLSSILKLPEKMAHATTILIILPMSLFSLGIYFFKSSLDFLGAIPIVVGFVVGGIIGAVALKKISNEILKIIFDIIILIAGVLSIIKF